MIYKTLSVDTESLNSVFFIYLGFLSQTFVIQRTASEGRDYFFNSSLPVPPALDRLSDITADSSLLHIKLYSNREPWVSERKPLTTKLRALTTYSCCNGKNLKDSSVSFLQKLFHGSYLLSVLIQQGLLHVFRSSHDFNSHYFLEPQLLLVLEKCYLF